MNTAPAANLPAPSPAWPVVKTYQGDQVGCIAMPLGGIGTGTISLGGRGQLCDVEVMNRPNKGFTAPEWGGAHGPFAAVLRTRDASGAVQQRALESALQAPFAGPMGAQQQNHGLPRFKNGAFHAAYPLAQVCLEDPGMPVAVRLEAFNPLVPTDAEASGRPVAYLRYVLINRGDTPVAATICATLENRIGDDGRPGTANPGALVKGNKNTFRDADGIRGLLLEGGCDPEDERWGTMALATASPGAVSHRTAWVDGGWGNHWLDFWDDLLDDGKLEDRSGNGTDAPRASLAVETIVPAHGEIAITFIVAWHFPNRVGWTGAPGKPVDPRADRIGNWYTTRSANAWAAAAQAAADLPRLEADTVKFVRALAFSDLPATVIEAALANLSTLRSQTVFRTAEGHLAGWEGSKDHEGSCHGSCTHVWNYEHATGALFGDLAKTQRELEFLHATDPAGVMSFRIGLPLSRATDWRLAAADGQMGALMRLHREWRHSGDDAWLSKMWPQARKALEFAWVPGGWDADADGVMEGCQHNTMDVEYFGPNPQMQFWYLGALRAAALMADRVGEADFAARCRDIAARGAAWTDANLFNGEWYEHHVRPPTGPVAAGLRHDHMGAKNLSDPDFQIAGGCLVDQLAGQVMAHLTGLGHLADPQKIGAAARAVWTHNRRTDLSGHFNQMRSYALNDEPALLMATWPRGGRPKRPFPYYNEVMTGFEHTAALALIQEGAEHEGVQAIADVRFRHDGQRRNPFDEAECGHHYVRAMAVWGAIPALTGFSWDAHTGTMGFRAATGKTTWFWATGWAFGTLTQVGDGRVELEVLGGELPLKRLRIAGAPDITRAQAAPLTAGGRLTGSLAAGAKR